MLSRETGLTPRCGRPSRSPACRRPTCAASDNAGRKPQKRGEIVDFAAIVEQFVVQLGDQLVGGVAVAGGNFREDVPEVVFQPDLGDAAVNAANGSAIRRASGRP